MKRAAFLAISALVLLTGCEDGKVSAVKKAVVADMKDPAAARFRNVVSGSGYICGEVNGKNGFGAYSGYQKFVAVADEASAVQFAPDNSNQMDLAIAGGDKARIDWLLASDAIFQARYNNCQAGRLTKEEQKAADQAYRSAEAEYDRASKETFPALKSPAQ